MRLAAFLRIGAVAAAAAAISGCSLEGDVIAMDTAEFGTGVCAIHTPFNESSITCWGDQLPYDGEQWPEVIQNPIAVNTVGPVACVVHKPVDKGELSCSISVFTGGISQNLPPEDLVASGYDFKEVALSLSYGLIIPFGCVIAGVDDVDTIACWRTDIITNRTFFTIDSLPEDGAPISNPHTLTSSVGGICFTDDNGPHCIGIEGGLNAHEEVEVVTMGELPATAVQEVSFSRIETESVSGLAQAYLLCAIDEVVAGDTATTCVGDITNSIDFIAPALQDPMFLAVSENNLGLDVACELSPAEGVHCFGEPTAVAGIDQATLSANSAYASDIQLGVNFGCIVTKAAEIAVNKVVCAATDDAYASVMAVPEHIQLQ